MHTCPDCGQACPCNNDIDDSMDVADDIICVHCIEVFDDDDDDESYSEARQQAKEWRHDKGYTGQGGVIVIYDNKVQGWVNELRDPQHWIPGCIAITEDGACYEAKGGNALGAKSWQRCA